MVTEELDLPSHNSFLTLIDSESPITRVSRACMQGHAEINFLISAPHAPTRYN